MENKPELNHNDVYLKAKEYTDERCNLQNFMEEDEIESVRLGYYDGYNYGYLAGVKFANEELIIDKSKITVKEPLMLCEACSRQGCNGNCIFIIRFFRWIKTKLLCLE